MEQKDYTFEIVDLLFKEETHIREVAKKLHTNHMTILRRINLLFKENVVDYKLKGKNKVYFIKKGIEARQYVLMTEHYKLLLLLKTCPQLRSIVYNIQRDSRVSLAIIFGSYAKHIAKKDSDIDIYLDTTNRKLKRELELMDSKLSIKIGGYDRKSPLIKEIDKNHIIIKGFEEYYEKREFFD